MLYFCIRSLAKDLLPSIIAAFLRGPKARMPAASSASTMPSASGSSGATITRSGLCSLAKATMPSMSVALIGTHSASAAMPPLPGAHQMWSTLGLFFNVWTMACSRPPPPITKAFIYCSSVCRYMRCARNISTMSEQAAISSREIGGLPYTLYCVLFLRRNGIEADLQFFIGGNVVAHGAIVIRLVCCHIKVAGTGQTE